MRELIEACCRGDRAAIEELHQQYRKLILRAVHSWFKLYASEQRQRENIDDVFHDVIVHILQNNCERLLPVINANNCEAYFYTLVMHEAGKCYARMRRQRGPRLIVEPLRDEVAERRFDDIEDPGNQYDQLIERMSKEEAKAILELVMRRCSVRNREVMRLNTSEERSDAEIAQIMGLTVNNVRVTISRTKRRIIRISRRLLGGDDVF